MTDELQPRPEPEPLPEPAVESLDDEEERFAMTEPSDATRTSPYGVAAFVLAVLGAYSSMSALGQLWLAYANQFSAQVFVRAMVPSVLPIIWSALAIWFADRAENEIFERGSSLGGVGLTRAARIIGYIVIVVIVLSVVGSLLAGRPNFRVGS